MSKNLIFKDGKTVTVLDSSVPEHIIIDAETFAGVDSLKEEFTQENITGATLGDVKLSNLVPVSIKALYDVGTNFTVHLISRTLTDIEIANNQITELQEAVAEIVGGAI